MRLPKARITLDLDQELLRWVMSLAEETGKSRNEVIGEAIAYYKGQVQIGKAEAQPNEEGPK